MLMRIGASWPAVLIATRQPALICMSLALPSAVVDDGWWTSMPPALATQNPVFTPDPYLVFRRVLPMVALHGIWASAIVGVRLISRRTWSIAPLLHMLTGSVLGLLLAFRTNQAFSRYWSACTAWAAIHSTSHNLARQASQLAGARYYVSFVRHLIALPISLKTRLRGQLPDPTELWAVLQRSEVDAVLASSSPHLVLLASLSLLILPLKSGDDGSGKDLALWGHLERGIGDLQAASCQLELVARLPPPVSYCVHTARFLGLWMLTLPLVLVDLLLPPAVPLATLAVAWAFYSTEELAKLLECVHKA